MPDDSTLSDEEIERLAVIMAKDPEALDRLATKLAEKVGDKLFEAGFDLTGINEALARIESKLEQLDTINHNIQDLRARHELHDREFRKVNGRLDSIDRHLGITTDTRRPA